MVTSGQTLTLDAVTRQSRRYHRMPPAFSSSPPATPSTSGVLLASGGGELDVQDSQINNTGTGARHRGAGTGSELLVDTATLKLVGDGTVTLTSGGAIVGNGSPGTPDTLENVNNTIPAPERSATPATESWR